VSALVELGGDALAHDTYGDTPLHHAAGEGHLATIKLLLELGANVHAQAKDGQTPLHYAAIAGCLETVHLLVEIGGSGAVDTQDAKKCTPLHYAASNGHDAVVSFLKKNSKRKQRRPKSTTSPVVDQAAWADAEAIAAAMGALLIAEEEVQKQSLPPPLPSKQGNSNKARKPRHRRKANTNKLVAGSVEINEASSEAISDSVASSSGKRDDGIYAGDDMGKKNALRGSEPFGEVNAHGEKGSTGLVFDDGGQGHDNEPENVSPNILHPHHSPIPTTNKVKWADIEEDEEDADDVIWNMLTRRFVLKWS
jgi:hypothetical protein